MKMLVFVLMMLFGVHCSAATVEEARLSDNVVYPVVHVGDVEVDKKINTAIIAEVDRFVTGVYRNAQVNGYEIGDVRTSYEVACNEAGNTVILSLVLTESNYFKGAAHPATFKRPLNFNTASGELMGLNYLIEVGDGFQDGQLLRRLEKALKAHCQREGLYLFEDALPLKHLPDDFYWDDELHVHFIFQHYAVAPYAAGIIDVDIDK